MGVETVAVYSEADRDSLHARMADHAVCIGPAPSALSYLNMPNIISAALQTGAQAIHPGYGFLAENSAFARACADSGLVFIGPSPDAIDRMGDKSVARETMMAAGVPDRSGLRRRGRDVRGGARASPRRSASRCSSRRARAAAARACASRKTADELHANLTAAKTEAAAAFGNDTVYIEKYLLRPRHVEMQVLADTHGNAVHLFERDCSIQRRHQKLVEEAPSPALTPELRARDGRGRA